MTEDKNESEELKPDKAEVEKDFEEVKEVAEKAEEAVEKEAEKEITEEKREKRKEEKIGIAYIYSTYNNTIIHITDLAGNTISRISGGMVTKHDRLKANPTIAMFVAKRAAERAKDLGITSLYIRTKAKTGAPGMGPGGHAALKSLGKEGFRIISILDATKFPRGGPKVKGGRRGRRV